MGKITSWAEWALRQNIPWMLKMKIGLGKYFGMGNNFVEEMGLKKLRPCRICQHPCYYHYPGEEAFNL